MRSERASLFCPIKMACEMLQPRWTIQIITEIWWGSSRFNEIRRGIPGISPGLLAKRLKELQAQGLVERVEDKATGTIEYVRTQAAQELEPIIQSLGEWAYRNSNIHDTMCDAEPRSFVWHMRHNIDTNLFPRRRTVLQITFPEQEADARDFWIVCRPSEPVDVCFLNPGFDVDLFINVTLEVMVSVWFGYSHLSAEIDSGRLEVIGLPSLARSMDRWMIRSSYARRREAILAS